MVITRTDGTTDISQMIEISGTKSFQPMLLRQRADYVTVLYNLNLYNFHNVFLMIKSLLENSVFHSFALIDFVFDNKRCHEFSQRNQLKTLQGIESTSVASHLDFLHETIATAFQRNCMKNTIHLSLYSANFSFISSSIK